MAISTLCPGCQTLFRLPDELAGKQVRCQTCSRLMMVPGVLSAPPKAAAPKPPPPSQPPSAAALPPAPPVVPPPAAPVPPPAAPPMAPPMPALPAGDGLPGMVLVEVPVKPVPPPIPEPGTSAPAPPEPRRPAPTMTLSRSAPGRRATNRPRRPTSVLAGLSLGGMLLLFVLLVGTSLVTWVMKEVQAQANHPQRQFGQGGVVQIQPNPPMGPGPKQMIPRPIQPPVFPQWGPDDQEPVNGARDMMQVFDPGPAGPKVDDAQAKHLRMENRKLVITDTLSNKAPRDPVRRWPGKWPLLPCKTYLVELEKGKHYIIDYQRNVNIQEFDPYLRVERQNGERLTESDDVETARAQPNVNPNLLVDRHNMNSRVELHPLKTETYRIICTLFQKPLPNNDAWPFTLTIREAPNLPPMAQPKLRLPQPRLVNQRMAITEVTEKGLKGAVVRLPQNVKSLSDLCWSLDGRSLYVLYDNGSLLKCRVDDFVEERRLDLNLTPGGMAMSGQGLVVTIPQRNEVWLIDPERLQVVHSFAVPLRPVPAPGIVASAPGLNFAYVAAKVANSANYPSATNGVAVLSLADKGAVRFLDLPNTALAVSPDGNYLFAVSSAKHHDSLVSYEINRDTGELEPKQTSLPYQRERASQDRRIDISPDSKYVCVSGGVGVPLKLLKENAKRQPTNVVVYPVGDLLNPAFFLDVSKQILVHAVGFDPTDKDRIYSAAEDGPLAVYDRKGQPLTVFKLREVGNAAAGERQSTREILVHPNGRRVVMRFPDRLCIATITDGKAPPVVQRPNWPTPLPVGDGESLVGATVKRGDVTYRELQLPNLGDIDPCWDADGRSLFHLEADGTLTRLSAPDFVPQDRLVIGQPAAAMALTAHGLLVALRDQAEVWLINPRSLKVERAIACPGPAKFLAAHPKLAIAAAVCNEVVLFDVKTGRVTARGLQPHPDAKLAFHGPTLSPDGQYLFLAHSGGGDGKVLRVRVQPNQLTIEESRPTTVKGLHAFCVTGDSKYVAWYTPNIAAKEATAFYRVGDWKAPAFTPGERARMIAPAGETALYVQTAGIDLQYLAQPGDKTAKPAQVPWLAGRQRIRHLAIQPNRPTAFVASTGTQVYFGERAGK